MWFPLLLSLVASDAPAPAAPAPEATAAATAAPAATPSTPSTHGELALEVGVDVPGNGRLPMAGTRVEGGVHIPLGDSFFAGLGLRSGYSYVAGLGPVADPVLGVDGNAFLMAHRIPVRAMGVLGVHGAVDAGALLSGGADVLLLEGQSFGRTTRTTSFAPGFSVGGFVDVPLSDSFGVGVVGEWDSVITNLAAATPGLSGDLSALRVALHLTLSL